MPYCGVLEQETGKNTCNKGLTFLKRFSRKTQGKTIKQRGTSRNQGPNFLSVKFSYFPFLQ